jgi:heme A synthase
LVIWAFRHYPAGHLVRRGAVVSIAFILLEALVGAGLVRFAWVADDTSTERVVVIAIHLINTFVLLAALGLTAWWASGGERVDLHGHGASVWWFAAALLGVVVIGVTGAITALGDTLFPAESLAQGMAQDFSPTAHFLIRLRVWHPVVAVLIGVYVGFLSLIIYLFRATPRVRRIALGLLALFVAQLAAGALNLILLAPTWMQVVHLLLADLVWVALVLLTAANFGESELRQSLFEAAKPSDLSPAPQNSGANISQRAPKP